MREDDEEEALGVLELDEVLGEGDVLNLFRRFCLRLRTLRITPWSMSTQSYMQEKENICAFGS